MNKAINKFLDAQARYESLEASRLTCTVPAEREQVHIAIMKAYLEVQYYANAIAGLQYADGNDYCDMN